MVTSDESDTLHTFLAAMADCGMSLDKFADAMAALPPVRERVKAAVEPAPQASVVQQEPVMIYHGDCVLDCGEHGHHHVELLKMIPAGSHLYTHPAQQAPQTKPAPAGSGGWEAHAKELEHELAYWKKRAQTMREHQKGECWYWQGDGNDHPESMVNSLPVVIRADALRALMAPQASVVQQEPVAWKHDCAVLLTNDVELWIDACPHCGKPRTHPAQQAKPQPLSDEQIELLMRSIGTTYADDNDERMKNHAGWQRMNHRQIARAIEAAHGIQGGAA